MKALLKLAPIALLLVASPLWADRPYVVVHITHNEYLRFLTISSHYGHEEWGQAL